MKDIIFIGNRLNVLKRIADFKGIKLRRVYVLEDSLLHKNLEDVSLVDADIRLFSVKDKQEVLKEIGAADFDILVSNGCPLILPVTALKKSHQLFINIHPTLLPDLKGKTPLNGVFMLHRKEIGATMHYIDDGIDTGPIIAQEKVKVTDDLDQGLVYKISFDLEGDAFSKGMRLLAEKDFDYAGTKQEGKGSYFNRTKEMQTIDIELDDTAKILDKVKAFGIKGQGSYLTVANKTYIIYSAERITNDYLLKTYDRVAPGQIAFMYNNRIIVRTTDGMIKLADYEVLGASSRESS